MKGAGERAGQRIWEEVVRGGRSEEVEGDGRSEEVEGDVRSKEEEEEVGRSILSSNAFGPIESNKTLFFLSAYPIESLIADVGGTMGLFLGFHFLMLWDLIVALYVFIKERLTFLK